MAGTWSALLAPGTVATRRREGIVSIVLAHRGIRVYLGPKHSANNVTALYGRVDGSCGSYILQCLHTLIKLGLFFFFFSAFCYVRLSSLLSSLLNSLFVLAITSK